MLRRPSLKVDLDKINNDTGLTLLHKAVLENDLDIIQLLIEHKANVNSIDEDSWTPLHAACACGYVEVAKYLLENGANPHALSRDEERPLDVTDSADFPLISLLLNYMREDSDDDQSDDDIMKYRRKSMRNSPVPSDPIKLAEFCKINLTKILNQTQLSLEEMACEIKVIFVNKLKLII
jgi:ankyrin repeat protein